MKKRSSFSEPSKFGKVVKKGVKSKPLNGLQTNYPKICYKLAEIQQNNWLGLDNRVNRWLKEILSNCQCSWKNTITIAGTILRKIWILLWKCLEAINKTLRNRLRTNLTHIPKSMPSWLPCHILQASSRTQLVWGISTVTAVTSKLQTSYLQAYLLRWKEQSRRNTIYSKKKQANNYQTRYSQKLTFIKEKNSWRGEWEENFEPLKNVERIIIRVIGNSNKIWSSLRQISSLWNA